MTAGPWLLADGRTTGLRPIDGALVDAAWDEVVAAHPIDPHSPTLRAAWVDKHSSLLSATYQRLLAEHDGLLEPTPKQLNIFAAAAEVSP